MLLILDFYVQQAKLADKRQGLGKVAASLNISSASRIARDGELRDLKPQMFK
jgi:hypothetical protein